jgi:hypothetical protein
MSVLSPKRVIQFVVASLLALPLLANHPAPRIQAKMAFDESTGTGVLFGGRGLDDPATGLAHGVDETWLWVRDQWVQQYPANHPSARSSHAMVYDSKRARVLLFGGRAEATVLRGQFNLLNDLWAWQNGDWHQLETGTAPPTRQYADMAYDRVRDRVVLFGGYRYAADGKTIEPLYDTWEFDGTSWSEVQAAASGPKVDKPLLAYDVSRKETILVGIDAEFKTLMYRWDPAAKTWGKITPETLPPCVHESTLSYQTHNQTLVLTGGLCADSAQSDEVWQWDGTTWTKIEARLNGFGVTRTNGSAYAYDTVNSRLVRYGGTSTFGTLTESSTYVLRDLQWRSLTSPSRPSPRSLATFRRDPARGRLWLFGGLSEFSAGTSISYDSDLWSYDGAQGWLLTDSLAAPGQCVTPISAFDTDRQVLVLVCGGQDVWEWNGAEWKSTTAKPIPDFRRFASLVYDQNIKKTVLFGGYDGINYRDETWTWDGSVWAKLKPSKKPGHRAQMSMWYDTRAKKTILYSGAGRPNIDEHVTRYADMWSFDGTTWTEMTKTAAPGIRFGAQTAVDPRDGKVLLLGGLRATIDAKNNVDQFYGSDTWLWDGASGNWTELHPASAPPARQNGAMEFDDASGRFILYGGFSGNVYLSDTWLFDGTAWTPLEDKLSNFRRRSVRP